MPCASGRPRISSAGRPRSSEPASEMARIVIDSRSTSAIARRTADNAGPRPSPATAMAAPDPTRPERSVAIGDPSAAPEPPPGRCPSLVVARKSRRGRVLRLRVGPAASLAGLAGDPRYDPLRVNPVDAVAVRLGHEEVSGGVDRQACAAELRRERRDDAVTVDPAERV